MDIRGRMALPALPPFDPVALATWLGAPIAVLIQPESLLRIAGDDLSESIGHDLVVPIHASVVHRFDAAEPWVSGPAELAYVRTRPVRDDLEPLTEREHIHQAMVQYQRDSSSVRPEPWMRSPSRREEPPPHVADRLNPALVPQDDWGSRIVMLDNAEFRWEFTTSRDVVTDDEIVGMGGQLGQVLVAVVGPERLLATGVAIEMVHPQ